MLPALAAALSLIAAPAPAPAVHGVMVQAPPSAPMDPSQVDQDKVVCRYQPVTGSRFITRVCMTQGKWDEWTRKSQAYATEIQRQSTLGNWASPRQMN